MEQPIHFPEDQQFQQQENEEMTQLRSQNMNLANVLNNSQFGGNALNQNLIEFQLEAETFKADLKRYIAGDEIKTDEQGNIFYVEQTNEELKTLNDLGVSIVMRIISGYITKQTFLSVYSEERINEIIGELGQLLRIRIYSNADKVGLDTEFKLSDFGVLVFTLLTYIESAYRRAIGGKEREGLREGRIVTQNQPLGNNQGMNMPISIMPKKKFNLFNSKSW